MMRANPKKISKRGDTIVEVLLTIAIIASVLAGAFTVTQKSAIAVRDSQERSEMLQILQGQVERVRYLALKTSSTTDPLYNSGYFCINTTNSRVNFSGPLTDNYSNYHANCKSLGTAGLYNVAVSYNPSPTSEVFTFIGTWDSLNGSKGNVQLSYRIPPGS